MVGLLTKKAWLCSGSKNTNSTSSNGNNNNNGGGSKAVAGGGISLILRQAVCVWVCVSLRTKQPEKKKVKAHDLFLAHVRHPSNLNARGLSTKIVSFSLRRRRPEHFGTRPFDKEQQVVCSLPYFGIIINIVNNYHTIPYNMTQESNAEGWKPLMGEDLQLKVRCMYG